MTNSQQKQQKLYQLLQDNNLQLSLADLIEFTYHQMEYDYLQRQTAVGSVLSSRVYMLDSSAECNMSEFLGMLELIGWSLTKAHKE